MGPGQKFAHYDIKYRMGKDLFEEKIKERK
jgi:hypothetical protein